MLGKGRRCLHYICIPTFLSAQRMLSNVLRGVLYPVQHTVRWVHISHSLRFPPSPSPPPAAVPALTPSIHEPISEIPATATQNE